MNASLFTARTLPVPVHRAGREQMGAERAAEHRLARGEPRGALEVDAGLDPISWNIETSPRCRRCRGARRNRAAAELAERGLEGVPPPPPAPPARWPGPGRGCCGSGPWARCRRAAPGPRRRTRGPGGGSPCRWCRRSRPPRTPAAASRSAISKTRAAGDLALVGASERRGDHALAAQALPPRGGQCGLEPGEGLGDRAVGEPALPLVRLTDRIGCFGTYSPIEWSLRLITEVAAQVTSSPFPTLRKYAERAWGPTPRCLEALRRSHMRF